MKIILLLISVFISVSVFSQEKRAKIFPFKSAIIEYKYEAGSSGTHIKYIDDYGYKQADYIRQEIAIGRDVEKAYETIILIGGKAYTANHQDETIAIGVNSTYTYYLQNPNRTPAEVSEALIKAEGYQLSGTKRHLGKECEVWKAGKSNKYLWNGLVLRSTSNFMVMMVEKATKIEIDVAIPESKFDIPEGLIYISSDHYQGYSGLELEFDNSEQTAVLDDKSIGGEFNSSSLESTETMPFYTQEGEQIIQDGVNDFNKIDMRIIKSQTQFLESSETKLGQSRSLIFMQKDAYGVNSTLYGKIQIAEIDDNGFTFRYMIFDENGNITAYSDSDHDALTKILEIKPDKNNRNLVLIPKNKSKLMLLGW